MIQLYSRLHNANNNIRRQFLFISLLLFIILHLGTNANAQCTNGNSSGIVSAPLPGNTVQINACAFAGDYSAINNVTATTSYKVTSSIVTDFFTVRQGTPGGPVIAFGITPLIWTSTGAGTYYSHINTNAGCGTQNTCRITAITNNNTCVPPVVIVTPATSCGGAVNGGPCNVLTASGADTYIWFPLAGLYMDCTHTVPYAGGNAATVYAAPTSYTVYTVTGTLTGTSCTNTATARVNYTPQAPVVTPNPAVMCLGDPAVKLKVASAPTTVQFCSGPINIPVPDNNPVGVSNSIFVSGIPACIITGLTVTINMPHTRIGNMVFVLKAPNGNIMNLDYYLSATGGNGPTTGFVNTIISSLGALALSGGANPYTATFRPDLVNTPGVFGPTGPTGMLPMAVWWTELFSVPNGYWTLGFYDGITSDVGTLTSWCLGITYSCGSGITATPALWSPISGLFSDPAATIPYIGTPADSVWARPTPAGTYTYAVTTESLPGRLASFTNPAAISIPVGGTAALYPSNLTVSGLPLTGVRVSSIVLNGVNHTRSNDIDVVLQSPTGQNVLLMSDVGGANAINATYTFIDWSPFMSLTSANPTGTYRPTNNGMPDNFPVPGPGSISQDPRINMLTGNYNGLWKLFVFDDDGTGDQGVISGGYSINFDTVPPCFSPSRLVVVTVGLPVSITTQPVNKTICTDGVATFSVTAVGGGTLNYQWQVSSNAGATYTNLINGGVYSGVTTATLTVTAPPVGMSGYYYRVIINGTATCAAATSAIAILTVNPLPNIVITANPLIIGPGETTTIFSTVTPNPAAIYTWYYNGAVLPGATADTLLVDINGLGDYQLQVTDVNGCSNLSNIIAIAHSFAITLFTYPNPSGGIFQVRYYSEVNNAVQRSLTVYSNRGEKIITRTFTQTIPYQKIDVDVRAYGKGLYWIELRDANGKRLAMNGAVIQ